MTGEKSLAGRRRLLVWASLACLWPSAWAGRLAPDQPLLASPDGSTLAVLEGNGDLRVIDAEGKESARIPLDGAPLEAAFSPDGQRLAVCLERGGLTVYDLAASAAKTLVDQNDSCASLSWSQDGRRLIYAVVRTSLQGRDIDRSVEVRRLDAGSQKSQALFSRKIRSSLPAGPPVHAAKDPPIHTGEPVEQPLFLKGEAGGQNPPSGSAQASHPEMSPPAPLASPPARAEAPEPRETPKPPRRNRPPGQHNP